MGRNKRNEEVERKFVPRISAVSRKLAARRVDQASADVAVPRFMREIKCQTRLPLAPIATVNNYTNSKASEDDTCTNSISSIDKDILKAITMNGSTKPSLDDNVFTFKPKVSTASAKIVENLGTDFMARQQQHLEKQKKLVSEPVCLIILNFDCGLTKFTSLLVLMLISV